MEESKSEFFLLSFSVSGEKKKVEKKYKENVKKIKSCLQTIEFSNLTVEIILFSLLSIQNHSPLQNLIQILISFPFSEFHHITLLILLFLFLLTLFFMLFFMKTSSPCLAHCHLSTFSCTENRTSTNSMFCLYYDLEVLNLMITKSSETERHLCRSSDLLPCSKQGQVEQVAQDHGQLSSQYCQRCRVSNISGQPL